MDGHLSQELFGGLEEPCDLLLVHLGPDFEGVPERIVEVPVHKEHLCARIGGEERHRDDGLA